MKELETIDRVSINGTAGEEVSSPRYWSIAELTTQIQNALEPLFAEVWVQGEVSNCRFAISGHVYFSLKDEQACLSAVIFGWKSKKKIFELKDGIHILCQGRIAVYPPRGSYQLIITHLEPLGVGNLQLAFEQLKTKLQAEGLFRTEWKRLLPTYPLKIVVITSPHGAVIQDIIHILKRRAPQIEIVVIPVAVQGEGASEQMIQGIELANQKKLGEVIILARGGGSIEDLWCFNDEQLARKIRNSELPIISAVGHEIDFTIADFVADLRAPTPSVAAELVSTHWIEVLKQVQEKRLQMIQWITREFSTRKTLLAHLSARVVNPKVKLQYQVQCLDEAIFRLIRGIQALFEKKRSVLFTQGSQLSALSPLSILKRGYCLVKDEQGRLLKYVTEIQFQQKVEIIFQDGSKHVQVI